MKPENWAALLEVIFKYSWAFLFAGIAGQIVGAVGPGWQSEHAAIIQDALQVVGLLGGAGVVVQIAEICLTWNRKRCSANAAEREKQAAAQAEEERRIDLINKLSPDEASVLVGICVSENQIWELRSANYIVDGLQNAGILHPMGRIGPKGGSMYRVDSTYWDLLKKKKYGSDKGVTRDRAEAWVNQILELTNPPRRALY